MLSIFEEYVFSLQSYLKIEKGQWCTCFEEKFERRIRDGYKGKLLSVGATVVLFDVSYSY